MKTASFAPWVVGGLLWLGTVGCTVPATAPIQASETAADPAVELAARVNQYRVSIGCPSLVWHTRVAEVARAHSRDMVARGYFGHVSPDGETPFDRLREAGIRWNGAAAENLASARATAEEVLRAWLASAEHRAVLDDCRYTHHGVGVAGSLWTHLFVSRPDS